MHRGLWAIDEYDFVVCGFFAEPKESEGPDLGSAVGLEEVASNLHYTMKGDTSQVTALLQELSTASLDAITSQDYSGALELLRSCSDIIDAVISSGGSIEDHQVLVTLNNSACCLQR